MSTEPTIEELHQAWTECIYAEGGPGKSEYLWRLVELRNAKTTWVGEKENELRFAIDKYLRGN